MGGYTEVPQQIMQGYRVMADEAADQWRGERPTHVFVQAGVGGVAAAVSAQMRARFAPGAAAGEVVEPDRAACLLASAELGEPTAIPGNLDTLMAGLALRRTEPGGLAGARPWRAAFMAIPDEAAVACMRLLAGEGIVAGELGVAGLAGCLLAAGDRRRGRRWGSMRRAGPAFITEGATDPEVYRRLVGHLPEPIGRAGLFRA